MKKIKSVKLAKNYLSEHDYCQAGTELIQNDDFWMVEDKSISNGEAYRNLSFHISDIFENKTGLFQIEYEDTEGEDIENIDYLEYLKLVERVRYIQSQYPNSLQAKAQEEKLDRQTKHMIDYFDI